MNSDHQTTFVPAYDTERLHTDAKKAEGVSCLDACEVIVEKHKTFNVPATFFIVGRVLRENRSARGVISFPRTCSGDM